MLTLANFPTPTRAREAFAGGFTESGKALLTLDELTAYDSGSGRGAERLFRCPFCGASERAFHVNSETGRFNCKRSSCAVKGILREFWKDAPQLSGRAKSQARLRKAFELDAPMVASFAPQKPEIGSDLSNWRCAWENALALDASESEAARDYLGARGVCLESAIRAGARFCRNWAPSPEGKIYRGGGAILFPLRDLSGQLRAVNGRYLRADANPKARTGGALGEGAFWAPPMDGFDWRETDALGIVEGPFDALALAACGAAALSLGGVNLPQWFARAVAFKAVSIGADADAAGDAAAAKWAHDVAPYTQRVSRLRSTDDCKDFGEMLEIFGRDFLAAWLRKEAPQFWGGIGKSPQNLALHLPAPLRRANAFIFVPAKNETAPGAAKICSTLQSFRRLFAAARSGDLPTEPLTVEIAGEFHSIENAAAAVVELDAVWSDRARECQKAQRDLAPEEAAALGASAELLETVLACYDGPGAAWLDLVALETDIKSRRATPPEQHPRRAAVLRGETVVANKESDGAFIEWAKAQGFAVGIMRQNQWKNAKWASEWANPFPMRKALEGRDRDDVCDRHAALLAESPELLARIGDLRGKVLVCCCHPARCHGDELARRANELTSDANEETQ